MGGKATETMVDNGDFASTAAEAETLGALAPFTTPMLFGARLRRGADGRLSLKTPGETAADSAPIGDFADMTLHDRLLIGLLSDGDQSARPLTPRSVAAAAMQVAALGASGRFAQHAAAVHLQHVEEDKHIAQFLLIVRLTEELDLECPDWRCLNPAEPAFHDWLIETAALIAPALGDLNNQGGDEADLTAVLEEIAALIAPVGLPGEEYQPEIRRALTILTELADALANHAPTAPLADAAVIVAILTAARRTLAAAQTILTVYETTLNNLADLVRHWPIRRQAVGDACASLDWLMDGWVAANRIWVDTSGVGAAARSGALREMALLTTADAAHTVSRPKRGDDPIFLDKIYRNELLRASAP